MRPGAEAVGFKRKDVAGRRLLQQIWATPETK